MNRAIRIFRQDVVARVVRIGLLFVAMATIAACNGFLSNQEKVTFDGIAFKSKSKKADGDDKRSFVVTVSPVSASFDGAREAGQWEGTKYCIKGYGSSDIEWQIGPETPPEQLTISDDELTFLGRCD